MKIISFLLLITLSMSGCSLIYSYSDNLPQDISQWIKQKKYKQALNTIEYIKPTHKDYKKIQQQKKLILGQINSYQQQTIDECSQLAEKGEWLIAFAKLDEASENLPNPEKILQFRNKLLKQQNKLLYKYEYEFLSSEAEELSAKIEFYDKIRKTLAANDNDVLNVSKFDERRHDISLNLLERGETEYKKSNYNMALNAINLAYKLQPDKKITARLNTLKEKIREDGRSRKNYYIFSARALLSKLSQGYSHEILKETSDMITQLKINQGNEHFHDELIAKLEKYFNAGVHQYFEAGRVLYSKGKTQEALSVWLELSEISPDYPKLKSHIQRAEKVLKKLKKLSEKPLNK